jgi:hypothetical protein
MKNYFLIVDTETTKWGKVFDFGAVVVDRYGKVYARIAVIITESYFNLKSDPLFFVNDVPDNAEWSEFSRKRREIKYNRMMKEGTRALVSREFVNKWFAEMKEKYNPILTAYNLSFDARACRKTGIHTGLFPRRFDLMAVAQNVVLKKAFYRQFVEQFKFFTPTNRGKLTAESIGCYVKNHIDKEPHTAYEDVVDYELPVLIYVLNSVSVKNLLGKRWNKVSHKARERYLGFTTQEV